MKYVIIHVSRVNQEKCEWFQYYAILINKLNYLNNINLRPNL